MFRAIGLVIVLVAARVLMPELFHALEKAGTQFFTGLGSIFAEMPNMGNITANVSGMIPKSAPLPTPPAWQY